MGVVMRRRIDELGRIVIPKAYLDFYKMSKHEEVYLVETQQGILITNPKYTVVKIEDEETNN